MKKASSLFICFLMVMMLSSCDAVIMLHYRVKNATHRPVKLKVTNYSGNWGWDQRDTTFVLGPGKDFIVGRSMFEVGFPGEEYFIYKEQPGLQNFCLVDGDSIVQVDNKDKFWTYFSGVSTFKITKKRLPFNY